MSIKEIKDFFLEQSRKSVNNATKISIKRKRHFAGALIPYYCVFGVEKDTFLEYCKEIYKDGNEDEEDDYPTSFESMKMLVDSGRIKRIVRIFYGDTIVMDIGDDEHSFFAYVESSPELAFSSPIKIQSDDECTFEIKTSSHWKKGMSLSLYHK